MKPIQYGIKLSAFIVKEDDRPMNFKDMEALMDDFISLVESYGYVCAAGWRLEDADAVE